VPRDAEVDPRGQVVEPVAVSLLAMVNLLKLGKAQPAPAAACLGFLLGQIEPLPPGKGGEGYLFFFLLLLFVLWSLLGSGRGNRSQWWVILLIVFLWLLLRV